MAKYKIGDRVWIRKDLSTNKSYDGVATIDYMVRMAGKKATIKKITASGTYKIEEADCYWTDGMFEDGKVFTKDMLESGMVVEHKDGSRMLVVKELEVLYDLSGFREFRYIKDDLTAVLEFYHKWDIVKVYEGTKHLNLSYLLKYPGKLIWEKPSATETTLTEVTLEDIAKKFNIEVKQLRIKD